MLLMFANPDIELNWAMEITGGDQAFDLTHARTALDEVGLISTHEWPRSAVVHLVAVPRSIISKPRHAVVLLSNLFTRILDGR